jgi:hypothetical protein
MSYQNPFHMMMRTKCNNKIKEDEKKFHHIKNQEDLVMKKTTHHTTPNMMDAYKQVQQSNHKPTTGEVNYRQQTASSYIPH